MNEKGVRTRRRRKMWRLMQDVSGITEAMVRVASSFDEPIEGTEAAAMYEVLKRAERDLASVRKGLGLVSEAMIARK